MATLKEYWKKRDFKKTKEPKGIVQKSEKSQLLFVIQKHAASRLHYDFRLELDGVLKSWAVPKGPSLDPSQKHLAVHVEDHPYDYKDFEGIIPQGQYGGGTVMLWDQGVWIPENEPHEGLRKGHLKFELKGKKLKGKWNLFRMKTRDGEDKNWLLAKLPDKEASTKINVQLKPPASAEEGRLPKFIKPQLATLSSKPPVGDQWLHEIKFDGYRIMARIDNGEVQLWTRNHNDWTPTFRNIAQTLKNFPAQQAYLDGEIVKLLPSGISSFQSLQNALTDGSEKDLYYYVFDILHWNNFNLIPSLLEERRDFLKELLTHFPQDFDRIRFSESIIGKGEEFYKESCRQALEGIISKRRDKSYASGRNTDWLKSKCVKRQEFVIAGFTPPQGSRSFFGALLLGAKDEKGRFNYAGRVGTGFTEKSLQELHSKLTPIFRKKSSFEVLPKGISWKGVQWVEPKLIAEIELTEWTEDKSLRHPSFEGLREDKSAQEITKEEPMVLTTKKLPITLTNPNKVLYPEQGITKQDLASYYLEIADWILPHIENRPLSLVRCPQGSGKKCFFQKHINETSHKALKGVKIKEKNTSGVYVMIDDVPGLIALVQMDTLEIHTWGASATPIAEQPVSEAPEALIQHPDLMVFDFDPDSELDWSKVIEGALLLRSFLEQLKLKSFVKTTGGKGLHVVVPLQRKYTWEEMKNFSHGLVQMIVDEKPKNYTADMSKAKRKGKIFIDYHRNGRGATAVAPYSTRARAGAPVATPLFWDELSQKLKSNHFNIKNLPRRLAGLKKDPWEDILKLKQSLPEGIFSE